MNGETQYEIGNEQAYAKIGLYGQQGSGKTFTAALFAIGLHKFIHSKKPIFFQDTETGSSFVKTLFDKDGIKLIGNRSRSFADLLYSATFAEKNCDIMIVDSVTHMWGDLCESYRKKKYECEKCEGTGKVDKKECFKCDGSGVWRDRLSVFDYAPIKKEWSKWVDFFVNSNIHFIVCGRAGGKYEIRENDEGKETLIKVEETFKGESEYGYECSCLIQMKPVKTKKGIDNIAFVWKDRFNKINGREFKMPKFEDILPHIQMLNIGGKHIGLTVGLDTTAMLKTPQGSTDEYKRKCTIVLEEIQAILILHYPSSSMDDKKAKLELLKQCFGTYSWTEIETMKLKELQEKYEVLIKFLNNKYKPK